jgi:hypothetical protein
MTTNGEKQIIGGEIRDPSRKPLSGLTIRADELLGQADELLNRAHALTGI